MNIFKTIYEKYVLYKKARQAHRNMYCDVMKSLSHLYQKNYVLSVSHTGSVKIKECNTPVQLALISSRILDKEYILSKNTVGKYFFLRSTLYEDRVYVMYMIGSSRDLKKVYERSLLRLHRAVFKILLSSAFLTMVKKGDYDSVIKKELSSGFPSYLKVIGMIEDSEITEFTNGVSIPSIAMENYYRNELIRKNKLLNIKGDK